MGKESFIAREAKVVALNKSNAMSDNKTLRFRKVGSRLYADENAKTIVGKESISWDAFDFGLSQRLVKNGYKIAITGDV